MGDLEAWVRAVHHAYQRADYARVAADLSDLITWAEALAKTNGVDRLRRAYIVQAVVYVAASKLAVKVGDAGLAWITADRAVFSAEHATVVLAR